MSSARPALGLPRLVRAPGATPSGRTTWEFAAAGLTFESDSYQWLTVNGAKAQFRGTGSFNGVPGHILTVSGIDGTKLTLPLLDRVRFRITDASGVVKYDSDPGAAPNADPATSLSSGQMLIKK